MSDEKTLLDDDAVEVKIGGETIKVPALCIKKSLDWTAKARKALAQYGVDVMKIVKSGEDDEQKQVEAIFKVVSLDEKANPSLIAMQALKDHSPAIFTDALLDKASRRQVVNAFMEVFRLENPTVNLGQMLTAKTSTV